MDDEIPDGLFFYKLKDVNPKCNNRRIHRGMFKSNNGTLINADVNGAYQIMKKIFPDFKWDNGCVLQPIIVYTNKK